MERPAHLIDGPAIIRSTCRQSSLATRASRPSIVPSRSQPQQLVGIRVIEDVVQPTGHEVGLSLGGRVPSTAAWCRRAPSSRGVPPPRPIRPGAGLPKSRPQKARHGRVSDHQSVRTALHIALRRRRPAKRLEAALPGWRSADIRRPASTRRSTEMTSARVRALTWRRSPADAGSNAITLNRRSIGAGAANGSRSPQGRLAQ